MKISEELIVENEAIAIGEDGTYGAAHAGDLFADQGYILFCPTSGGLGVRCW